MNEKEYLCVQCDMLFLVSADRLEQLENLGFDEPTRCPECRKRKSRPLCLDNPRRKSNKRKYFDDEAEIAFRQKRKFKRSRNVARDFME